MVLVSPPVMVKSQRNFVQMAWCSTTMQSTKKNATFLSTLTAANGPIYVSNIILMHENTNLVLIGNVIRHAYVPSKGKFESYGSGNKCRCELKLLLKFGAFPFHQNKRNKLNRTKANKQQTKKKMVIKNVLKI